MVLFYISENKLKKISATYNIGFCVGLEYIPFSYISMAKAMTTDKVSEAGLFNLFSGKVRKTIRNNSKIIACATFKKNKGSFFK